MISIITINLNNKVGLMKTLASVIDQDHQDFEWIFIDGQSKDGSWEYVKEEEKAGRIRCKTQFICEGDSGIYDAMNKGILRSEGDYLLFLNSGDYFQSAASLGRFMDVFQRDPGLEFYSFGVELEGSGVVVRYPEVLSERYFWKTSLCHQSTFIAKKVFKTLGNYHTDYKIVADRYHFLVGIFKHHFRYLINNEHPLVIFNAEGISSSNYALRVMEIERMFAEEFGDLVVRNMRLLDGYERLEAHRNIWRFMIKLIAIKQGILSFVNGVKGLFRKLLVGGNPGERNDLQRLLVKVFRRIFSKKEIHNG